MTGPRIVTPCWSCGNRRRCWWMGFFVGNLCQPCIDKTDWKVMKES